MYDRNHVAYLIVECLKKDPEALATLSSALVTGLQVSLQETQRKSMVYYDGMISALALTDKRGLSDDLIILMNERVKAACAQHSCGYERKAFDKAELNIQDVKDRQEG